MTGRRRLLGAALGLLLVACGPAVAPARAQTTPAFSPPEECSDPPPAPVEDEDLTIEVHSPTGATPVTTPDVAISANVRNVRTRPLVGSVGEVDEVRVSILRCLEWQVAPEDPDPLLVEGEPAEASYSETVTFPTNGRFAVVFEAVGSSPGAEGAQSAREVAHVNLAVPPAKPTNVAVSDPVDGVVKIVWDYPDPPADLLGFEVRRAKQGTGDYTTVKGGIVTAKARSVSDQPPAGAWRYHVVAYRNGAPDGAISRDDTVEVPEAATTADAGGATTGTTAVGTAGTGASAASSDDGTGTTASTAPIGAANTPRASVDLSRFAAALNARRQAPVRVEPPDPGFEQTLPFDVPDGSEAEEEPAELGADEPNVGIGQRVPVDPGERRRSMGFVAFGLLLFVLSMTGLFLKGEVKRADLVALDPDEDLDPMAADDHGFATEVAVPAVAVATRVRRRRSSSADTDQPDAAAAPVIDAAPAVPARSRRLRRQPATEAVEDADRRVDAEAGEPPARRRSRRAAPPVVAAPVLADFDEPASSRRGRRVAEPVVVDDFRDLREDLVAADARRPTSHRPRRRTASPLDAPGLDIPDPAPATPRAASSRPRRPGPARQAALPRRADGRTRRP